MLQYPVRPVQAGIRTQIYSGTLGIGSTSHDCSGGKCARRRLELRLALPEAAPKNQGNGRAEKFQKLLQDERITRIDANPTGFLLMFPACIAAQIEANPDAVDLIIGWVRDNGDMLGISSARVISLTDDIPERAHANWAAAFVAGDVKAHSDTVEASAAVATASDINLKFLAFGRQLRCGLGLSTSVL